MAFLASAGDVISSMSVGRRFHNLMDLWTNYSSWLFVRRGGSSLGWEEDRVEYVVGTIWKWQEAGRL